MLATLGDLVEDIVIRVDDPLNVASDTNATIDRRRGGSAANVAMSAAASSHRSRFLGQVGADPIGSALLAELAAEGVDVSCVRRGGRTGTIAVLVDRAGERTMLTDRGACDALADPSPTWLDGVTTLHVPLYSLAAGEMATSAVTVIGWADRRGIPVTIDASSVAVIDTLGRERIASMLASFGPAVVFANEAEADALGAGTAVAGAITIVKRGALPTRIEQPDVSAVEVPVQALVGPLDTTGAGDAFAAGFLTAAWRTDVVGAVGAGHRSARTHLLRLIERDG